MNFGIGNRGHKLSKSLGSTLGPDLKVLQVVWAPPRPKPVPVRYVKVRVEKPRSFQGGLAGVFGKFWWFLWRIITNSDGSVRRVGEGVRFLWWVVVYFGV